MFAHIQLDGETFTESGHTRLKQLEHLIRTGQLDDALFWATPQTDTPTTAPTGGERA